MTDAKYRVAIIGCGRMGQGYADAYSAYPDTEIVALISRDGHLKPLNGEATIELHDEVIALTSADSAEALREVLTEARARR